jgi:non-heme chloroperoxidase
MLFFLANGYRVIAHDRRGHGRSTQTATGHDMDTYAAMSQNSRSTWTSARRCTSGIRQAVGSSALRCPPRRGQGAKAVLIGAVPPIMVKSATNPAVFLSKCSTVFVPRSLRIAHSSSATFLRDRSTASIVPAPGFARRDRQLVAPGMMGGANAHYECIKAFSETDFTEDLKSIEVPVLILHGDDDQIVPIADSALLSAKLVRKGTLKVYPGLPHGMCTTHADVINPDLLAFIRS